MDVQRFLADFEHFANASGGITHLRHMIYHLGVIGSLTSRGDEQGEAGAVLADVELTRERLIREKSYKRMLELESEPIREPPGIVLPPSWRWTRLLDIGEINPRNNAPDDALVAFLPMSGVPQLHRKAVVAETRRWGDIKKGFTHFAKGDVVLAKITPCFENGKAAFITDLPGDFGIGAGSTELLVFRPIHPGILPGFVYLYLRSPLFAVEGEKNMTGTAGQKRVPTDYFATRAFPLPPTEEQSRIVAKVDELMGLCDRLEKQKQEGRELQNGLRQSTLQSVAASASPHGLHTTWTRLTESFGHLFSAPGDVAELRSLVLDLGMRGVLVDQDPSETTAKDLLEAIKEEKGRKARNRKLKLQKSLPQIREDEIPFNIPKAWEWVRLGQLAELINGDRGKNYPNKHEYVSVGVPWINTGHIEPDGTLTRQSMNFISREKFESLNGGKIEPGDLVYCLRGATFGKTAFVTPYEEGAIASSLMIVRAILPNINRYLYYYLISPLGRSQIFKFDNGTAQPNLSADSVGLFLCPLPPSEEQERIIATVERLMQTCDVLESQLRHARGLSGRLAVACIASLTGITIDQPEDSPVKAPQTELIAPLRLGKAPDAKAQAPLATLLARHKGEMSAQDLWQRFGGEIDAFYTQLKTEVAHGWIAEPRPAEVREKTAESPPA